MADYPYIGQLNPKVGGGLGGLPVRLATRGEMSFTLPGTHSWAVPEGVLSVSVVCVGGGSSGNSNTSTDDTWGGAGGALAWTNNIQVLPGETIEVIVGDGGVTYLVASVPETWMDGGYSQFKDASTCKAGGGSLDATTSTGGTVLAGDGGGNGGDGVTSQSTVDLACSGAGAGGYTGDGADGVSSVNALAGLDAPDGGGGGSGGTATGGQAAGGGGVGLFGEGASGDGGIIGTTFEAFGGKGGSDGEDATNTEDFDASHTPGGKYGGGGSAEESFSRGSNGGHGGVRIIWGDDRSFPATDVGQS